jgi:hypothetical protein
MLLTGREPAEQREYRGVAETEFFQGVHHVADLTFAGAEDEDVAVPFRLQLDDGLTDRLALVPRFAGVRVVAEVMINLRSWRRGSSRLRNPSRKSTLSERSWASSMISVS